MKPQPLSPKRALAFTLIELLIVVAIIAILAAIAVPNFLEAQIRSKVSRVKADMRTVDTALTTYFIDNNAFPTGFDDAVDPARPESHSLFLLSTPISYVTSGDMQDPFQPAKDDRPMYSTVQYDPMTADGRMFSIYNLDGAYIRRGERAPWWLLFSVGPDGDAGFTYDLFDGEGTQYRVREADQDLGLFLAIFYDPTNGSVSRGNVWRSGGSDLNAAGLFVNAHH
jgi:prepilin-type N-terminal cleavage/methylation domain-containing protein